MCADLGPLIYLYSNVIRVIVLLFHHFLHDSGLEQFVFRVEIFVVTLVNDQAQASSKNLEME
jgi:hypothetical protein